MCAAPRHNLQGLSPPPPRVSQACLPGRPGSPAKGEPAQGQPIRTPPPGTFSRRWPQDQRSVQLLCPKGVSCPEFPLPESCLFSFAFDF